MTIRQRLTIKDVDKDLFKGRNKDAILKYYHTK